MPNPGIVIQITGDNQVDAVFRAVETQMQRTAAAGVTAGREVTAGMDRARESAHLLNEELGLHIPRAMQRLMATTPGIAQALNAAFSVAAIGGFVSIIGVLLEKLPELTNAMMGFGEAEKKAFDQLAKGNAELVEILKKADAQQFEDSLLGMSASGKDSARQKRIKKQMDDLATQRRATEAQRSAVIMDQSNVSSASQDAVFQETGIADQSIGPDPDRLSKLDESLAEIDKQATKLGKELKSLGTHKTHDFGDEIKASSEKAHAALDKLLAAMTEQRKEPIQQQLDAIAKVYDDDIAKLQKYGRAAGLTQNQITHDTITLLAERAAAVKAGMEKISAVMTAGHMKSMHDTLSQIGAFDSPVQDPFKPLVDEFEKDQKQMKAALSEEAEQEKLVRDQGIAAGESQIEIEGKLAKLRQQSAAQLQQIAARMLEIAKILQDPVMIDQAQKANAQLEDMSIKTKTLKTEIRQGITGAMENSFGSMISAIEHGKNAFKAFADSMIQDISRMLEKMFEQLVLQKALNALFGAIPGFGGGGGAADAGSIDWSSSFPGAAGGGDIVGPTVVGEAGVELFIPKMPGTIIPHTALQGYNGPGGRQQAPNMSISLVNNGTPQNVTNTGVTWDDQGKQWVVGIVMDDLATGGPIAQGLGLNNG